MVQCGKFRSPRSAGNCPLRETINPDAIRPARAMASKGYRRQHERRPASSGRPVQYERFRPRLRRSCGFSGVITSQSNTSEHLHAEPAIQSVFSHIPRRQLSPGISFAISGQERSDTHNDTRRLISNFGQTRQNSNAYE